MLFAAYVGPSMNPTLRAPELMEIVPYADSLVRVGDVVFFLPPHSDRPVAHRVARVTPAGITTLGDNNTHEDAFLLQSSNIRGQVVAAWRGQRRREIPGGLRGQMTSHWLRWRRVPRNALSALLRPLYFALSRCRVVARLLPALFRPRVVVFHTQGHDQCRLLLGRHIIGRYDDHKRQWQIQRPFRLLVHQPVLQRQQDEN